MATNSTEINKNLENTIFSLSLDEGIGILDGALLLEDTSKFPLSFFKEMTRIIERTEQEKPDYFSKIDPSKLLNLIVPEERSLWKEKLKKLYPPHSSPKNKNKEEIEDFVLLNETEEAEKILKKIEEAQKTRNIGKEEVEYVINLRSDQEEQKEIDQLIQRSAFEQIRERVLAIKKERLEEQRPDSFRKKSLEQDQATLEQYLRNNAVEMGPENPKNLDNLKRCIERISTENPAYFKQMTKDSNPATVTIISVLAQLTLNKPGPWETMLKKQPSSPPLKSRGKSPYPVRKVKSTGAVGGPVEFMPDTDNWKRDMETSRLSKLLIEILKAREEHKEINETSKEETELHFPEQDNEARGRRKKENELRDTLQDVLKPDNQMTVSTLTENAPDSDEEEIGEEEKQALQYVKEILEKRRAREAQEELAYQVQEENSPILENPDASILEISQSYYDQLLEAYAKSIEEAQNLFEKFNEEPNIIQRRDKLKKALTEVKSLDITDTTILLHYTQLLTEALKALGTAIPEAQRLFNEEEQKFNKNLNIAQRRNEIEKIRIAATNPTSLKIQDDIQDSLVKDIILAHYQQLLEQELKPLNEAIPEAQRLFNEEEQKFDKNSNIAQRWDEIEKIKMAATNPSSLKIQDNIQNSIVKNIIFIHYQQLLERELEVLNASMKVAQSLFEQEKKKFNAAASVNQRHENIKKAKETAGNLMVDPTVYPAVKHIVIEHYIQLVEQELEALNASMKIAQKLFEQEKKKFGEELNITSRHRMMEDTIGKTRENPEIKNISDPLSRAIVEEHYTQLLNQALKTLSTAIDDAYKQFQENNFSDIKIITERFEKIKNILTEVKQLPITELKENEIDQRNQYGHLLEKCVLSFKAEIQLGQTLFDKYDFKSETNIAKRFRKIQDAVKGASTLDIKRLENLNSAGADIEQIYVIKHCRQLLEQELKILETSMTMAQDLFELEKERFSKELGIVERRNMIDDTITLQNPKITEITEASIQNIVGAHYIQLLTQAVNVLDAAIQRAHEQFNNHKFGNITLIAKRHKKIKATLTEVEALHEESTDQRSHYIQLLKRECLALENEMQAGEELFHKKNAREVANIEDRFKGVEKAIKEAPHLDLKLELKKSSAAPIDEIYVKKHMQQLLNEEKARLIAAMNHAKKSFEAQFNGSNNSPTQRAHSVRAELEKTRIRRLEQERAAEQERVRLVEQQQRLEQERAAEQERVRLAEQQQRLEQERVTAEQERLRVAEQQRLEQERQRAEQERVRLEEQQRLEQERAAAEALRQQQSRQQAEQLAAQRQQQAILFEQQRQQQEQARLQQQAQSAPRAPNGHLLSEVLAAQRRAGV